MNDARLIIRIGVLVFAAALCLVAIAQFSFESPQPATMGLPQAPVAVPYRPAARLPDSAFLFRPSRSGSRLVAPILVEGAIDPLDATSFRNAGAVIRLGDIRGPGRDAVCRDETGALWSCGLQARVALVNILRASGTTQCRSAPDVTDMRGAFHCVAGGEDLSHLLVRNGWARPTALKAAAYRQDLDTARSAGAGLWRGSWSIVDPASLVPLQDWTLDMADGERQGDARGQGRPAGARRP